MQKPAFEASFLGLVQDTEMHEPPEYLHPAGSSGQQQQQQQQQQGDWDALGALHASRPVRAPRCMTPELMYKEDDEEGDDRGNLQVPEYGLRTISAGGETDADLGICLDDDDEGEAELEGARGPGKVLPLRNSGSGGSMSGRPTSARPTSAALTGGRVPAQQLNGPGSPMRFGDAGMLAIPEVEDAAGGRAEGTAVASRAEDF